MQAVEDTTYNGWKNYPTWAVYLVSCLLCDFFWREPGCRVHRRDAGMTQGKITLFGYAESTDFKYQVKFPQSDHKLPPELDPKWQLRAVVECLAGPLDDDWMSTHKALIARLTASDPQFQYNPRTKAGKALRDALMSGEEEK